MHSFQRHSRAARAAAILLLGTLAVRAMLPVGYMPGNLLEGKFAELCPIASAATYALLPKEDGHHHHAHNDDSTDSSGYSMDSACPIGTSLLADVLPGLEIQVQLDTGPEDFYQLGPAHNYVARPEVHYPARAPPLS